MDKNHIVRKLLPILFIVSCTSYPDDIEDVLRQAGKNRKELEKVLKHYEKNPVDSLKLCAAEFLIVNMPGKYSEYREGQWNDLATMYQRWTSSSDKQLVLDTYQLGEPIRKDDVMHITAEYLINNIDLAFKVWHEQPWGKTIPFDVFCEEILPYRLHTEPLENWREKVLASFADLYNSFRQDTSITTVEACCKVNDVLPRFRMDKDFPHMSYSQLMASTRGVCDQMAALGVFVMRGLGIPVTNDFTPVWPYSFFGHSLNSVRDSSGLHHSFQGAESNPGMSHSPFHETYRVYRHVYADQRNVADKADIPSLLYNINNIVDVTSEYGGGFDIWFPIPKDYSSKKGFIYLAVLNKMEWNPIAWGVVGDFVLEFQSMRYGLYLPVYYQNGILTPIDYPFKYDGRSCRYYQPSLSKTKSLTAIAPGGYEWLHRMIGGKFEVANRSDFSDGRTIHTIEKIPDFGYNSVSVGNQCSYRYIRYISPVGGRCHVSILEFYDENNEILHGTAIGTPGINESMNHNRLFDSDVDTYYEAASDTSWVGLDLGEARRINKIRYLPRTGGNGIYHGHVYELFYWNWNEWQSLGRKTAESRVLQYKVPDRALLYIKNVTINRMHNTPFYIESGVQRWFHN